MFDFPHLGDYPSVLNQPPKSSSSSSSISVLIFEQWHEETSSFRSRADPLPGYAQERRSEIMALGRRPDFHLSECQLVIESRTEITEPRRAFQPLINRLMRRKRTFLVGLFDRSQIHVPL
jgi:hypothetical protein